MTLWLDIAEWRGPVLHHSGTIVDHKYVVIHTADGTYEGTIAWQKSPQSDNSSHFIVDFNGKIAQVNDTANRSGAQIEGNPFSIAIENAGDERHPLTDAQLTANAKILAKAHQVHGIPLQLTGKVGIPGLGHHSMGAESGVNWGHSQCPGNIIKAQKPEILKRALAIVNPPAPITVPLGDYAMIVTCTDGSGSEKSVNNRSVPANGRIVITPSGPWSIASASNFDTSYWKNTLQLTWADIKDLCESMNHPQPTA